MTQTDQLLDRLAVAAGYVLGSDAQTPPEKQKQYRDTLTSVWLEWRAFRENQRGPDGFCHGQVPYCGQFLCPKCRDDFDRTA